MLRISNKDFLKSLNSSCENNQVLYSTLEKYKTLKKRIKRTRKELTKLYPIESNQYNNALMKTINNHIKQDFTLNEVFLIMAIFTANNKLKIALSDELPNDAGLWNLVYQTT